MMIFDNRPYCIAMEAQNVPADFLRLDFCYRAYTSEKVKDVVDKLLKFEDIKNIIKGNFLANNI